jgi:hypothetical protein
MTAGSDSHDLISQNSQTHKHVAFIKSAANHVFIRESRVDFIGAQSSTEE